MGFLDPNSWANAFDTSAEDARNKQLEIQQQTQNWQRDIYDKELSRQMPYYQASMPALAYLQSAVLGGPQTVNYKDAAGKDASYTGTFAPGLSPSAKYQYQIGATNLNRNLASRGLLGSGSAARALTDLNNGIAASDWEKQYARLLDLVAKGAGAAAGTQSASAAFGNQLGNNAAGMNSAINNGLMNQYYQNAQNTSSLYGGIGTGMKVYDFGKGQGWWGNDSGGSSYDLYQGDSSSGDDGGSSGAILSYLMA